MAGRFIVLEGLDGAGTTTQGKRLTGALQADGLEASFTFEPSDRPVGRLIRKVLEHADDALPSQTLPWLFAADRSDHLHRDILPALAAGRWVVCDRYKVSSLAYQSTAVPHDVVWDLNRTFPDPDLTVFLDVPPEVCLERIAAREPGQRPELFERLDRLTAIAARYREVIGALRDAGGRVLWLDGRQPKDEVSAAILAAARAVG